ncbi:hypothetical protein, partial [Phascolarctobacterium succinatutens]|uniref:hypothetical protein n=1 Tax=Phascolarctobacterium succinatutens TaxID=626940 RepID=UPI0026ED1393
TVKLHWFFCLRLGFVPASLWYNMLFLNHIRNSIAGELDIKPLISNYDLNEKKERLDQYNLALYNLRIQYREI